MTRADRSRTARDRARDELTGEITTIARAMLAEGGAAGLSLRAVSREMGMASSAIYRYFPSRDDLLTRLIIDAYDDLGAATEAAITPAGTPHQHWRAAWHAVRDWAHKHPHEYALIYGSPVPGYEAPGDTITPAGRAPRAIASVLGRAHETGLLVPVPDDLPANLAEQAGRTAAILEVPELPEATTARLTLAWTQLLGLVSAELFGHLKGTMDPPEAFFGFVVARTAELVGLPAPQW